MDIGNIREGIWMYMKNFAEALVEPTCTSWVKFTEAIYMFNFIFSNLNQIYLHLGVCEIYFLYCLYNTNTKRFNWLSILVVLVFCNINANSYGNSFAFFFCLL